MNFGSFYLDYLRLISNRYGGIFFSNHERYCCKKLFLFIERFENKPSIWSFKCSVDRRRINMRMLQNVLLIYMNSSADYRNIINTFTDGDPCVNFLRDICRFCIIISGALCHDVAQLHSIFIFCENKTRHEQWAKTWSKIKGIFTRFSPICEAFKQTVSSKRTWIN